MSGIGPAGIRMRHVQVEYACLQNMRKVVAKLAGEGVMRDLEM